MQKKPSFNLPKVYLYVKFIQRASMLTNGMVTGRGFPCIVLPFLQENPSVSKERLGPSGVKVLVHQAENIISGQPTEDMPTAHKGNI